MALMMLYEREVKGLGRSAEEEPGHETSVMLSRHEVVRMTE